MISKKTKLSALLLLGMGLTNVHAQETRVATGGNVSGGGGSVSYSIGQVNYTINIITKDDSGMYGVRYNDFIAPMVKAIQELDSMNQSLKIAIANERDMKAKQVEEQQKQIIELQNEIKILKAKLDEILKN